MFAAYLKGFQGTQLKGRLGVFFIFLAAFAVWYPVSQWLKWEYAPQIELFRYAINASQALFSILVSSV
jgi:hypothetical protein